MARGNSVELGTRSFKTKAEATAFFKEMLNRYKPGDQVVEEDALHLIALLVRHPENAGKMGSGISHFEIIMTEYKTQCFCIVRTDGTKTDFSYGSCIKQSPPTRKQEVSQAFRSVIREDIVNIRDRIVKERTDAEGMVTCATSGERIPLKQAHMDHLPPLTFEVIVEKFLGSRGLTFSDIPITEGQDNQVTPEITDEPLRADFRAYHLMTARLDLVKDKINLAQSSRYRLK